MVKQRKRNTKKKRNGKGFSSNVNESRKINASTQFDTCTERLSPFGGLLVLIKFIDLINLKQIFDSTYNEPSRQPKLDHYSMVIGIVMLLFIGFNRVWHFVYVRVDALLCGFFRLTRLPAASTFWRYLDSLGINQAQSFLAINSLMRERVWRLADIGYCQIRINIDTTVETIYGNQQGGRKGHNTKNRGKKGYRPVLCFIEETSEYLFGYLRKGETLSGKEAAKIIREINSHLPGCVQYVILRADGEFLSWQSVEAAIESGFEFIIGNKGCNPPFDPDGWYRPWKRKDIEFNSCLYEPMGWGQPCRFVAMRIPKEQKRVSNEPLQCHLFKDDRYVYRIFCTNLSGKTHKVIAEYDKRASVENLVGEAKREGLDAIPSAKFKNNYAFFQIVMLAYNMWRYMKIMAQKTTSDDESEQIESQAKGLKGIMSNTIRIARLRLLFIASKVVRDGNVGKVKYSIHDARTPAMLNFLNYLDMLRSRVGNKVENSNYLQCDSI
jgi:hypothetical protein